jgi:hypothetical protein
MDRTVPALDRSRLQSDNHLSYKPSLLFNIAHVAKVNDLKRRTITGPPIETSIHCFDFDDFERRGFRNFCLNFVRPDTAQHSTIRVNIVVRHPRR